ncbi:sensor domain-containing diguanylate cyclase [Anaerovorax odorimutans]|uniref:sensor domain-containing diguanylate cyclase n=1 Tax=Anaerovorax odorimutans TaxID=109327 RepID=UPI0004860C6A|nr:diguanylate cyclase [Anaerovorax odorimutans]
MKVKSNHTVNKIIKRYFFIFACLIAILIICVSYYKHLDKEVLNTTITRVKEISNNGAMIVDSKLKGNFQNIESISIEIENVPFFDVQQIINILKKESKLKGFDNMSLILENGLSYSIHDDIENNKPNDVSNKEYFKSTINASKREYKIFTDDIGGEKVYILTAPIFNNGEKKGIIVAFIKDPYFDKKVKNTLLYEGKYYFVANKDGSIISVSYNENEDAKNYNFIDYLQRKGKIEENLIYEIKDSMKKRKSGIKISDINGRSNYISYTPLKMTEDYFIVIIPAHVIEGNLENIQNGVNKLIIYMLLLFMVMIIYLIIIYNKIRRQIESSNRQQAINNERYRIITEQSGSIIFEYDMITKSAFHTSNFKEKFGYAPVSHNYIEAIKNSNKIYKEDIHKFLYLIETIQKGTKYYETEFRIKNFEGIYLWIRVKATGIFDNEKKLLRIVGKMIDITQEKKEIESLKAKVNKDSGTGVYNKQTTHNLIDDYLKGEGKNGTHALLIIDIDNFKCINDTLGHRQGDAIISFLAEKMKGMFRSDDIIGRIGGDEFMILIKNITDTQLVADKAKALSRVFDDAFSRKCGMLRISNSVGIAIYKKDGTTYDELYEAADTALYCSKDEGKGTFVFYNN